jgi:PKD repeat protein
VDGAPVARASVVCTGWSCRFDATKSTDDGRVAKYTWSFGDGLTGSGASITHNYKAGGSYAATLTVTDDIAQKDTAAVPATTTPRPPTAAAKVTCVARTCTLSASASKDDIGIASYTWDFLDATLQTGVDVTKSYATAGTKKFKLTVRNTNNLSTTVQGQFTLR